MTQEHPITPPFELVEQWYETADNSSKDVIQEVAAQAARWGADQQLVEDAKWLDYHALNEAHLKTIPVGDLLKEAMRPKPLSLKEQSIALIDKIQDNKKMWDIRDLDVVRQALESLPD